MRLQRSLCEERVLGCGPRLHQRGVYIAYCALLDPERSIKGAILDRFAHVLGCDRFGALEVGDRARDFQDAIVGAGAQIEFRHRDADQFLRFVAQFADAA